ncbi:hypothetical protein AAKU55_005841 [Oxalobacteraceae bacterium GrIS 1.11]
MADLRMLARRQIRLAALGALRDPVFAGVTVESPGDWTTPAEVLPAILLRATDDRKESVTRGQPEFTTTTSIEIDVRVGATDPAEAQDAIEALCYLIELALMTNYTLISMVSQVASYDTRMDISSDGQIHFGAARMTISFEISEVFDPFATNLPPPLTSFGLHFDAGAPFDANGNYANPAFPAQAAPRTCGPDGRDEGALDILLPQ